MRISLLAAVLSLVVCGVALAESPAAAVPAAAETSVSAARTSLESAGDAFDFPRASKDQTRRISTPGNRKTRVKPLAPCGGCYCYTQCDIWADECKSAPASHCTYFGSSEPCACGPCVCS